MWAVCSGIPNASASSFRVYPLVSIVYFRNFLEKSGEKAQKTLDINVDILHT
jgi:hypothetical protein